MTTIVHEQRKWMDLVPGTSATSAFDENSGRQVTLQCQNWPVGNFAFGIFGRPLQTYKVSSCEREHTWEIDSERYRAKIRRFFTPAKVDKLLFLLSAMKQKALVKEYVDRIGRVSNANMDG